MANSILMQAAYGTTEFYLDNVQQAGYTHSNLVQEIWNAQMLWKAQKDMRFAEFATYETGLEGGPGSTIRFHVYGDLEAAQDLTEDITLNTSEQTKSSFTVTTAEVGNKIALKEQMVRRAFHDQVRASMNALARDIAITWDNKLRDAALSTPNILFPNLKASPDLLVAGDQLDVDTLKDAETYLAANNTPRFDGQYYVGIFHPYQIRSLMNSGEFMNAREYQASLGLFPGEMGMFGNIRIVVSSNIEVIPTGTGVPATTVDTYKGVVFGQDAYGMAVSLWPEMRVGEVLDLGRVREFGWLADIGASLLFNDYIYAIQTATPL